MVHQWTLPQMNPWSWRKVGSLYLCTCNVYVYSDTLDIIMKSSNSLYIYTSVHSVSYSTCIHPQCWFHCSCLCLYPPPPPSWFHAYMPVSTPSAGSIVTAYACIHPPPPSAGFTLICLYLPPVLVPL